MVANLKDGRGGRRNGAGRKPKVTVAISAPWNIYVVAEAENQRTCKIGITSGSLAYRISGLQVGNPRTLVLIGLIGVVRKEDAVRIEAKAHAHFSHSKIRGEWFSINASEVSDVIRRIAVDLLIATIVPSFSMEGKA